MKRIGMIVAVEIKAVLNKFGAQLRKREAAEMCLETINEQ